jgi:hypothetical protein
LIVLTALYACSVGAVVYYCKWTPVARVCYISTRQLPPNHRLVPGDITRPPSGPGAWGWSLPDRESLEGKYVTDLIPPGEPVQLDRLQLSPDLTVGDCYRPTIFPLDKQPQLSDLLNANSYVDVTDTDAVLKLAKVRVHGVVCPKPNLGDKVTQACYAILAVPADKQASLADKSASLRLVPTIP